MKTDFPTAWAVMRATDPQQHHERCSYRQTNGGVLCDCAASKAFIATVEMANKKSFSELIIEGNEARKTCEECGQLCVAYREKFRKGWITCLHAMENHSAKVTYKQLADILVHNYDFGEKTANSMARSFIMSRHWKVIEKTANSIGRCPIYRITEYGREVVANTRMVFKFLWIPARDVEIDLGSLPAPDSCFANEILPDDPNDLANKALHVEQALPAF
jgi:hypothetical protein